MGEKAEVDNVSDSVTEKDGEVKAVPSDTESPESEIIYLSGWRLHFLTVALCICILLVNLDVSIVSTSLISIAESFGDFKQTNWIVSAYLVTYTSFLISWAKFSDIFGRKWPFLLAFTLFVLFSVGCAASQSMPQLIICRAFQGFAGSGSFSLSTVIILQMVPKPKIPLYGLIVFTVVALSTVMGPLVGGAINVSSTWRWIFVLNIPSGALAIGLCSMVIPADFPRNQPNVSWRPRIKKESLSSVLRRIDFAGTVLLLAASLLLITALSEAPNSLSWDSASIVCLLVFSALLWIGFLAYERYLTRKDAQREPTFPWRFFSNRVWMAMLVMAFLVGIPMTVITIDLPQRFQIVNQVSPLQAGIRLLPYSVGTPIGSFSGNLMAATTKARPIYLVLSGSILQLVGLTLLTTIPSSGPVPPSEYAFLVIVALGSGLTFSILMTTTPHAVEQKDLAVGTGSIVQLRMMGSTIGLAVATTILNNVLVSRLSSLLTPPQLAQVLQSVGNIPDLSGPVQQSVEAAFGDAFSVHIKILLGVAAAQTLVVPFMWRRPQLTLH